MSASARRRLPEIETAPAVQQAGHYWPYAELDVKYIGRKPATGTGFGP
jgi:hypothetical protein